VNARFDRPHAEAAQPDERRLDGNAMAGDLQALFGFDMTVAVRTCASCGHAAPLGAHPAYTDAPGAVLRCPNCSDVALRIVSSTDRLWIEMRGTGALEIPR
jgi:hypothetical protein